MTHDAGSPGSGRSLSSRVEPDKEQTGSVHDQGPQRAVGRTWLPDGSCLITGFDSFDLHATCQCGQAFRWRRTGGNGEIEEGVVEGRLIRLEQCNDGLIVHRPACRETVDIVVRYFRLEHAHSLIEDTLEALDPVMARAVSTSRGLRLAAQDPWECLISYILSANNSVQQISRVVESLADTWGSPTLGEGPSHSLRRAFPGPEALGNATECDVRACKAGFRAIAVCQAAEKVSSGKLDLDKLSRMSYSSARAHLIELRGVGEKIADCVLLFSMGKFEAFPVDVWIERAVRHFYFSGEPASHREIRQFAAEHFGSLAGYAQEYLFNFARTRVPDALRAD